LGIGFGYSVWSRFSGHLLIWHYNIILLAFFYAKQKIKQKWILLQRLLVLVLLLDLL
jgi:hypothetical protein